MLELWHDYLYQPLLNLLFFLYDRFASENLGVAVIELTVIIRMALLPFSIVSERKRARFEALSEQIATVGRQFKNDRVKQREETRKLLRVQRVSPWAKVVALGGQVLVFILLYQVFLGGLRPAKLIDLYASVRRPDVINTMFFGFDIGQRNIWWALAVAILLFIEIVIEQGHRRHTIDRRDLFYRYIFPLAVFGILFKLPMVKSLFLLTTMAFSAMLFGVWRSVAGPKEIRNQ